MISNAFLLVFAIAFMGCVLSTPLVTRIAAWAGAIDHPDQFRRIHKGATPRLGGLGVATGLAVSVLPVVFGGFARSWPGAGDWWSRQWSIMLASLIVLAVGAVDDARGLRPRVKLLGQSAAVLVLILGGIRITKITLLGIGFNLSYPIHLPVPGTGLVLSLDLLSAAVTLLWFLGCMNIWNLIDGMDGLASGVGLLVSGTLMLVAIYQNNPASALLAAALAGSLAGFLLYNWHPAVIFLGDSGSLLIGLLLGIIGVQDSLKGTVGVTILFPILAMGLPISDTAMAIFRRWVRNLPLSSADRRHIHHLLIGLGLRPWQAALLLYCFSGFLCGAVLLGVAWGNEFLALLLGLGGCLAFLLILTSRRDELATLWAELRGRMARGRQERAAAKVTWETIQRIELCEDPEAIWALLLGAADELGCDVLRVSCYRGGKAVFHHASDLAEAPDSWGPVSGPSATFRLSSGQDLLLAVALHQAPDSPLAADIAFRFLQRLALATAERLERILAARPVVEPVPAPSPADEGFAVAPATAPRGAEPQPALAVDGTGPDAVARESLGWLRWLGLGGTPVATPPRLGEE
ncbi:MAG TPA: MraY family glycosyltransferase [Isosphaeraceae bacterium]|jgi:UDP-GlcNAc:undecaprenyl-phosphate GlcNAc-1-phosphate transferase|nr:MraY family glycosyltransferase [Isosphaeraceae bacterium]